MDGVLHQIKAPAGGGKRWLQIEKNATYQDVLEKLKEEYSLTLDQTARVASFDGLPMPQDQTYGDYVREVLKPKSYPRIYLITTKMTE